MPANIYPVPGGRETSELYQLTVDGASAPVLAARVSAVPFNRRWPGHQRSPDQAEQAAYAMFETDGPVKITVKPQKAFRDVVIRPLSKGVEPTIDGGQITFTLPGPGGYTLELDGYHNALHLFADPVKRYDAGPTDKNLLYFGPGVHEREVTELKSNQTLFIDAGAVLFTRVSAENAENVRILGRGVIDNSRHKEKILFELEKTGDGTVDVCNSERFHTIQMKNCRNVEIDGVTIHDSLVYNIALFGCEDVLIDNVKTIGCWRYNTDGIDLHNCGRCIVRNCFVRAYDDAICVKGHDGYPQICGDTLVENCVVWCDWGKSLEIGAETRAEQIKNVTFRHCDLIRNSFAAMDIFNVDYGDVHDILYEDIRVEYDDVSQRPALQRGDGETYAEDPESEYMPKLFCAEIAKHGEYSGGLDRRGRNRNITFKDIRVYSKRMPPSAFGGFDEEHQTENVKIINLTHNGSKVKSPGEARITVHAFAEDIEMQ